MKPIRWGILGASNFALGHMGPAIHAAKGADLVAVASSSAEKVRPFQAFAPQVHHIASYDAMLADPQIDAIYIPLPNHLHVEWALKANKAGKHVLVEKPIALRANQINPLIAARDASGLQLAEAFMIVHHPQWLRARDWVQSGEIGRLRHVDAAFSFYNDDPANIRNRAETGGGSLPDIGVYTIGSARFVTGAEPADLSARLIRENGVEVWAQISAVMRGANSSFTYQSITTTRAYNRQVVTFQGDKGMVRLEGGPFNANVNDLAAVELHQGGNRVTIERFAPVNHYGLFMAAGRCPSVAACHRSGL
jgi:predicted dehydrogenase